MNNPLPTDDDLALVRALDGIHVGLLDAQDLEVFERCVSAGTARRSYEGAAGFIGLAKVRIVEASHVQ